MFMSYIITFAAETKTKILSPVLSTLSAVSQQPRTHTHARTLTLCEVRALALQFCFLLFVVHLSLAASLFLHIQEHFYLTSLNFNFGL